MNDLRAWLNTAPPEAKLGYLIGQRHGAGYHINNDTIAQLAYLAGLRDTPITITRITPPPKPAFDPNAQCSFPGCTNPIGEYRGGRHPIMCIQLHRHINRYDRKWTERS